jgi:hypothetical protein
MPSLQPEACILINCRIDTLLRSRLQPATKEQSAAILDHEPIRSWVVGEKQTQMLDRQLGLQ